MKSKFLILIGVLVFIISVALGTPAALLYSKLAGNNPGAVQLVGLEGSVSEGSAGELISNGRALLSGVRWRFAPLSLLLGRLAFHIEGGHETLVNGTVALTPFGPRADNLKTSGNIATTLPLITPLPVPIEGQFDLALSTLKLHGGYPTTMKGQLKLNSLHWTLGPNPLALGDLVADIVTEKDQIVGKFQPTSGPLDIGGEIRLLNDHNYEVDLQVKAKPNADATLQNLLHTLGQADTQGYFHIKSRGQL